MATTYSGSASKNGYGFYIEVWEERLSNYLTTNQSRVYVALYLKNGNTRTNSSGWTFKMTANGYPQSVSGQTLDSTQVGYNQAMKVWEEYKTITHNDDGSATVSISAEIYRSSYSSYDPGYCSASGTFTCQTIPRKSSVSIADNSITAGVAKNITVTSKVASFKDTLRVKYNGETIETIVTKAGGSSTSYTVSWTPSLATYANKTSASSFVVTLENETYNGDTSIGTNSINVTVSIPNNSTTKPAITGITLAEANSVVSAQASTLHIGNDTFIQGMSRIQATIAATSYQAATISSGSLVFNNNPAITGYPTVTTNTVTSQGNNLTISGTVTDSRGFTSNAYTSKKYNVIPYHAPTFTAAFERCASNGTSDDAGTSIKYTLVGSISSINNYNTKLWRIRYKQKGASSWSGNPISLSTIYEPNITTAVVISGLTCDADKSYIIRLEAIDVFNTDSAPVYRDYEIGVGADILNINASGKSIGIGQLSTAGANERKCEIGTDSTYIKENLYLGNNFFLNNTKLLWNSSGLHMAQAIFDLIYPVGSIYMSVNSTNPGTLFGGTWVAFGAGRALVGVGSNGTNYYSAAEATGGADNYYHSHPLSRNGYTRIIIKNNGNIRYDEIPVTPWTDNFSVLGSHSTSSSGSSQYYGATLGGNTDSQVVDTRQCFITCYMWKRTA